jgi:hypothetical protein
LVCQGLVVASTIAAKYVVVTARNERLGTHPGAKGAEDGLFVGGVIIRDGVDD